MINCAGEEITSAGVLTTKWNIVERFNSTCPPPPSLFNHGRLRSTGLVLIDLLSPKKGESLNHDNYITEAIR